MNIFFPQTGSIQEWNAAYYRLEDYLRAHHVTHKVYQSQLILHLLKRAAARHPREPLVCPTALALQEAYAVMDQWYEDVLGIEGNPRISVLGRVAMLLADSTERWPAAFLSQDGIPEDLRVTMQSICVKAGPDLRVSSMVPRAPDNFPLLELEPARSWSAMTAMLLGVGVLGVLGAVLMLVK